MDAMGALRKPNDTARSVAPARALLTQDDFNHKRIVAAVDSQLAAKGLTMVEAGGMADILVAYGAGFDRNLQITGSSSDWGGPFYRGNRSGSAGARRLER